jgi:SpoIID/LytB domain protein
LNFKQLPFKVISYLLLSILVLVPIGEAQASTISVKLVNYLGNKTSIDFDTVGSYKLANNNTRYSGKDRFEVANNVASGGWTTASTVFVVNYDAFADALSAAPLAKKMDAPILLTTPTTLPDITKTKIQALHPSKIMIIGGIGSVSGNVEKQLKQITSNVERIGGIDRFEVAMAVSEKLGSSNSAIVTNGLGFADALAIAPYASINQIPILLTYNDKLPENTKKALQGKTSTLIIGGTGSVNKSVEDDLKNPTRIGGADRYEVSANIINQLNLNAQTVFLSNGYTFADALTGSVLAAKQNAPMLLTRPQDIPSPVLDTIRNKKTSIVNVLGGPASVTDQVISSLPNEYFIEPNKKYTVSVDNGRLSLFKDAKKIKDFGTSSFTLTTNYSTSNLINIYGNGPTSYLGNMEFTIENSSYVRPINKNISFEDYLKSVVPREMPASWGNDGMDALKAQAVAARTYAIDQVGTTVKDDQSFQVYGGYRNYSSAQGKWLDSWSANSNRAVDETSGQVLKFNGKLIDAVFSSSNGGYTVKNTDEWPNGTPVNYLDAKPDPFDNYTWTYKLPIKQLSLEGKSLVDYGHWWYSYYEANSNLAANIKSWLRSQNITKLSNDNIKIINISNFSFGPERNSSQRSLNGSMTVDYLLYGLVDGSGKIKMNTTQINTTIRNFRTWIGGMDFKSTYLDSVTKDANTISITGKGFGHGVGMSQQGAYHRALAGQSYQTILEFYYPGSTLGSY